MTWRQLAQQTIRPLEIEYRNQDYGAFKRALFDAYPFGERKYTPYKIWCEEQRNALLRHKARNGEPLEVIVPCSRKAIDGFLDSLQEDLFKERNNNS